VPDKTRGNVVISLSAKLDRFIHGRLADCFAGKTDIVPEMCFQGAIIVLAMPALTWNEDGIVGQQLMKFVWQRAVSSRNALELRQRERFLVLWMDEAHYFINTHDEAFLSTCRSSRVCVVAITQTLPTYYARMGKDKSDAADGIVGKFANQLFFSNICPRTNQYASSLVGRGVQHRASQTRSVGTNTSSGMNAGANTGSGTSSGSSHSFGGNNANFSSNSGHSAQGGNSWGDQVGRGSSENTSWGTSEHVDNIIEPRFFATSLKCGGSENKGLVTALWVKAGGSFAAANGDNSMVVTFRQPRK
jgi:hypothetical protein